MANATVEIPTMDWKAKNLPDAFKLWKQRMEIYFQIVALEEDQKVPYILQGSSIEGIRRYNTFTLTEAQKKVPAEIWTRFENQLKITKPNFRSAILDLQAMSQYKNETLDEFVTRLKTKCLDCEFDEVETSERIIEQLLKSTPIKDFQKYILSQAKGVALETVLNEGRKLETTFHNIKHIKETRSAKPDTAESEGATASIDAVYRKQSTRPTGGCKRCGRDHKRDTKSCPAINSKCHTCGKIGHWEIVCNSQKKRGHNKPRNHKPGGSPRKHGRQSNRSCLLYTSDAADD